MNLDTTFYLTHYIQNMIICHVISTLKTLMMALLFSFVLSFPEPGCISHSQHLCGQAIRKVLSGLLTRI